MTCFSNVVIIALINVVVVVVIGRTLAPLASLNKLIEAAKRNSAAFWVTQEPKYNVMLLISLMRVILS